MKIISSSRKFLVWQYAVDKKQLLIRSPKGWQTNSTPSEGTNLDLLFNSVKYWKLPACLIGIELVYPSCEEVSNLESILETKINASELRLIVSNAQQFYVIASELEISENNLDIFETTIQQNIRFRSQVKDE